MEVALHQDEAATVIQVITRHKPPCQHWQWHGYNNSYSSDSGTVAMLLATRSQNKDGHDREDDHSHDLAILLDRDVKVLGRGCRS